MTENPFTGQDEDAPAGPIGGTVNLGHVHDYVIRYRELKAAIAAMESEMADVRALLEKEMGRADTGLIGSKVAITWKSRASHRLDSTRLKEEEPELYRRFAKSVNTRYFIVK